MNENGLCPSEEVDSTGRYEIKLWPAGRYALIPAPASGNIVHVRPRWVSVGIGQTKTININGANMEGRSASARATPCWSKRALSPAR
jgi:hypothetical protein